MSYRRRTCALALVRPCFKTICFLQRCWAASILLGEGCPSRACARQARDTLRRRCPQKSSLYRTTTGSALSTARSFCKPRQGGETHGLHRPTPRRSHDERTWSPQSALTHPSEGFRGRQGSCQVVAESIVEIDAFALLDAKRVRRHALVVSERTHTTHGANWAC